MKHNKFVVLPPAGSGSKGDEGMMKGALTLFSPAKFIILNPQEREWKGEIGDCGYEFEEDSYSIELLQSYTKEGYATIIVGADVIDGSAGLAGSILRLDAMKTALELGGEVFTFFSFRSDPEIEIIQRLQEVASNKCAHFYLRDEHSFFRFKKIFDQSNCEFFPDLAFYCSEENLDPLILEQINSNNSLNNSQTIALNFSEQSFRASRVEFTDDNRKKYIRDLIDSVISVFPNSVFLLLTNDIRSWNNFWSDYNYALEAKKILLESKNIVDVIVVEPTIPYVEIISLLRNADLLVSGRMHLSIAAVRAGCVPFIVTNHSHVSDVDEKQRGMFDKARGMLDWCFGRPEFVVTSSEELSKILISFENNSQFILNEISEKINNLDNLLMSYESTIKQSITLDTKYEKQTSQITVENLRSQSRALKKEKYALELKLQNVERELINRGTWALELAKELEDIKNSFPISDLVEGSLRIIENVDLVNDKQLKNANAQLKQITSSNSWRITLPLREINRWLISPRKQTKRYLKFGLGQAKHIYKLIPFSYKTKAVHRNLVTKYLPRLVNINNSNSSQNPFPPMFVSSQLKIDQIIDPMSFANEIKLLTSEFPQVSIVIPVYGKIDYTLHCLASISSYHPQVDFEIIVVDDCSPDNTFEILSAVNGIVLIRNNENLGFIRSCNKGADSARGEYIYFLNNDTQVTHKWLDELLQTFHEFPGTGLVGSKLIYPDGKLQEAGGLIWRDGNAWNFGKFNDPSAPIYNYAREVDYCSGASILLPKSLFEEIGGFDEHFLPAYCEDSDLALKIREKGYRVIYQPMSTVIHFEGVTSGNDLSQGTKAYQVENTRKLNERWKNYLQYQPIPGVAADVAIERQGSRRVLILDHCTPTPDQDAGSLTVFNLMLLFREMNFQVTFIPEDNYLYIPNYTAALQRSGIEVLYAPYIESVTQHLKEFGHRYEVVFLIRPRVAERHLKAIRKHCPKSKVIFHTVDLHFLRMSREAELQSNKAMYKDAEEMKLCELNAILKSDATIIHSTSELELLRPLVPENKLHLFPLIMNINETIKPFTSRRDIVFVGSFQHAPNIDAVLYFVNQVMPFLRKHLEGVRFYVVGNKPPAEIQELASEDVIIKGFVEDLTKFLDQMRVSVAPLRYGAGIKGKVGTAMANGLPVVATSLAAEGMSLTHGENVCIADGAEEIAETISKVYLDESLWNHISYNGLQLAERLWGGEAAWSILANILDTLGIDVYRGKYPISLYSKYESKQKYASQQKYIESIGSVCCRNEFESIIENDIFKQIRHLENQLINESKTDTFYFDGICVPCKQKVSFLVDMKFGSTIQEGISIPNWRERLVCPLCNMNNRQRLISTLIAEEISGKVYKNVYFMEQVTPIFCWASSVFSDQNIVGSEYLGHDYPGGATVQGIRHEDIENLSFDNEYFDLIVSNDVFEHVPNPAKGFSETARILKPGGMLLATIPFNSKSDISITRAHIKNNNLEFILPPNYHGNPISPDGSLVFTDFGWDLLEMFKEAGFTNAFVDIYASSKYGHMGNGQLIFKIIK